ncbi:MAG: phage tail protein [Rhizobiaceae bacterium]|nr:phage tail protein [Rhizobiaceae bacterium]
MADKYLGEILAFGFSRAPDGWARCDGTLLRIDQNKALFSVIGTIYGGDGKTNFALPDLRGRLPMQHGEVNGHNFIQGDKGGYERVRLNVDEMPSHKHNVLASGVQSNSRIPENNVLGLNVFPSYRIIDDTNAPMAPNALSDTGKAEGHENMQPFLALNYCIAVTGLFPEADDDSQNTMETKDV